MSISPAALAPSSHPWRYRLLAAFLILLSAGLRLAYLTADCPLDLAPDEAHYWDWSRHLDWSYYSKGPLVAYLIRGGCLIAGDWSEQLTGSAMAAVRLPAVLCGALLLVSLYILTVQVFGRTQQSSEHQPDAPARASDQGEKLAFLVVALALTFPVLAAGSSLMTIDAPFTCCWGWALVLGHRAIFGPAVLGASRFALNWPWLATGLLVGLGILAKYTMVLWLVSAFLFLLTSPAQRHLLFRPGFWLMIAVTAFCCLPILIWNMQHDWVTLRHVNGLAGGNQGPRWFWYGPFAFLGGQCVLFLVSWFVAWLAAMIVHRPWVEADAGIRYLWWLSAPTFLVFLLFSPKTGGGELNWPVTAYLSGLLLAVAWVVRRLSSPRRWSAHLAAACLALTCLVGLAAIALMYFTERAYPLLAQLAGPPTEGQPMPLRRLDPTCRLRGWRTLAAEVDRLRDQLRREGIEPVLAGSSWSLPGELGFYCTDHPAVYCLGPALGDRHSQYDFWRPNPILDPAMFHGRTFILVDVPGGPALSSAFDRVGPSHRVIHAENGHVLGAWVVTVCHGYQGFPRIGPRNY